MLTIREVDTEDVLLLTVPECARMLRMSAREVNRAIRRGGAGLDQDWAIASGEPRATGRVRGGAGTRRDGVTGRARPARAIIPARAA